MQRAFRFCSLSLALLMGGAAISVAQGLPGGASALDETHGDWRVTCAAPEGDVRCAISQVQVSNENRQRILTVELSAAEGGNGASGMLVLPFGLALDRGAVLSVDEGALPPPLRFSTCLPVGCLVPLSFDRNAITAMRDGTALKVEAAADGSGQKVGFSISLAGFTAALARAAELDGH